MSDPKSQDGPPPANPSRRSPSPEGGPRSTSPWPGAGTPAQVRSATPAYPLPAAQGTSAPAPGAAAATRTLTPANSPSAVPPTSSPAFRSASTTQILTPSAPASSVPVLVVPDSSATGRTLTPANQNAAAVAPAASAPATSQEALGASVHGSPKTLLLDGSMLEAVRARAAVAAAAAAAAASAAPVPTPDTPVRKSTPAIPQPAAPVVSTPVTPTMGTAISVRTARPVRAEQVATVRPARPGGTTATYQSVPAKIEANQFEVPTTVDPHLPMLMDGGGERAAAFRALRRRLAEQKDPRAILVTSAEDEEGKTTCAANLALALAESGRLSVLLVEANLRRPKLSAIFGFQPSRCLRTQLSAHREQIDAPWQTTELRPIGLQVLALAPDAGSSENLHGPTFSASIARWRGAFDYVVIDGPSILESCDASIIHDSVDAVVMVARSSVSRNRTVKRALEQISADMVAGMVLMDAPAR